jgi:capsular exopolysaccharide synthesis family protein
MLNQPIGAEGKQESVDVKEYLAVLLKRKWLVLVCFLLSMALTTAFLFTRQPIYRATAKMLITVTGGSLPTSEITRENERNFMATQIEIMKGQPMLRRVQQRLKKAPTEITENLSNLEIKAAGGNAIIVISVDSPSKEFARDFANALADEYLKFRDEQRAQTSESALLGLTREINRLGQELKTANDRVLKYAQEHGLGEGRTSTWSQEYTLNVQNFAEATRALANAKAKKQLLDSRPDTSAVLALLASDAETAASSRIPVASERAARGGEVSVSIAGEPTLSRQLLVGEDGAINYPPIGTLNVAGLTAEEIASKLQAVLEKAGLLNPTFQNITAEAGGLSPNKQQARVRVTLASSPQSKETIASASPLTRGVVGALSDPEAQRLFQLEQKRVSLQARLVELEKSYKSKHPAVVATQQDYLDTVSQIESAIQFYKQKADADLLVTQRRYDEVVNTAKQLDAAAINESAKSLEFAALQEDTLRVRNLYNTLLGQLMKLDVTQGFKIHNISVLEPAIVDPEPVYPKKVKGLMVAALFGLGLGLALAFFIEYIDDSIKLAEEVERDLQLPFLGMIPAAQWSPDDLTAHRLDKLKQQGGVAESYRVVRSAIMFSTPREKLRSILLGSAVPREGKTTTCVNLSIGFSQTDERVLLIDADLRRGEIHKYFGLERDKGLAEVLLGEAQIEEVIKPSGVPKLDIMTCGPYPANPAELLLGWRLKEVLSWAHKHYDRVILDGPPVMGIADSSILGAAVDGVLFVIWAGRTSRRYVRVAKMTAVSRGAKIFGFVLNNLEPGRVGYYHYYPYYYSYYSRGYYYAHAEEEEGKGGDIKGIEMSSSGSGDKKQMDDIY